MKIDVLGPISIEVNGRSIVPTAGKQRQLLTLLALRCGRVVPIATLMEELWGDSIPRSGLTTLQTYVLYLRRLIAAALPEDPPPAAASKELLTTRFGSYQLAAPCEYDLADFEGLASRGDSALERGDATSASELLGRAMGLWRGPALMDVPLGRALAMELIGMEEAYMRVQEQRIRADLWLGKHSLLIPELRKLVAQHPMHENISACLMIAYQRSGASWRALEVFRNLRTALNGELGVEPSGRLQSLHQELLSNTPELSLTDFVLS
ncbi:BTAD domain-containing putative transcriptional regulator [Streptomyces sp. NPDC058613]|uniref:AfsR/SARP family transcriptional regulator n=1 Tax=unclassified Streptomyces TaxID=2593676 RepID=UPI0036521806